MTLHVSVGPGQYIRKPFLLEEIGSYIKSFGEKVLAIGGETALSVSIEQMITGLTIENLELLDSVAYGGNCSWSNIQKLIEKIEELKPDVLLAVGGGTAIDTVKAVGYATNLPIIAIPTIAATCAATTSISILYDDEGTFIEISRKSKAPNLVLVDTAIIKNAPYRFLAAGIGDTLAKWFESKASIQKAVPNALNRTAVKIAEELYQMLLEQGPSALEALKKGKDDPAIDDVIDSIILVSGSVSGYGGDDCRTAAAHAIYSGLTIFPEIHETYHGEIVAFGILAQLVLEGKTEEEILNLVSFYEKVDLPSSLAAMNLHELSDQQWKELGEVTVTIEDMDNMPFEVTPKMVIEAVKTADMIGRKAVKQ
ncbi:iron-containing alcohol dehydrogenase family protein [Litchfieldia alkalitelluris]|uniref:iron-containing alcohol dehydrogenase family protein n=1 Tax=Litchfieldia alkalitelluris TaxID=304268 RepID=UPI001F3630A6|nr:iron-containing alcohol dehydrogenase family protein [Litchfieldia alkalitelluris]